MKDVSFLGIDLAKSNFQLHGINARHRVVLRRKVTRHQLLLFMGSLPPAVVFMEACSGSHYFGKKFESFGHRVKLIAPQFVKPFVKSNKNDQNDAEAIVEAGLRPSMTFVPLKSQEHLDVQTLHKVRRRLVKSKTALMNEIRGLLSEQGIVIATGVRSLKKAIEEILNEKSSDQLSSMCRQTVADLHAELSQLEERIEQITSRLKKYGSENELARRLQTIPGVGIVTATAILSSIPDHTVFKNGRHFAAWAGLVPRHTGTGGKNRVQGISKRGDAYLRTLLIQGAKTVLRKSEQKTDKINVWVTKLKESKNANKVAVALANKNARIIMAMIKSGEIFKQPKAA